MRSYAETELVRMNKQLQGIAPAEIIHWVMQNVQKPLVITGFSPFDSAILQACSAVKGGIRTVRYETSNSVEPATVPASEHRQSVFFRKLIKQERPDVVFTSFRRSRSSLAEVAGILSYDKDSDLLIVSPFYHWSDQQMFAYLEEQGVKISGFPVFQKN